MQCRQNRRDVVMTSSVQPTLSSVWDFMIGLDKPQLHAKFEVAGFICYRNIREFVFENWDKPKRGNPTTVRTCVWQYTARTSPRAGAIYMRPSAILQSTRNLELIGSDCPICSGSTFVLIFCVNLQN